MNAILKVGGYLVCLLLPWVAGCAPGMADKSQCIRHRLEEYDPADRIRAIRDTVDLGDESLIPALVDRLGRRRRRGSFLCHHGTREINQNQTGLFLQRSGN